MADDVTDNSQTNKTGPDPNNPQVNQSQPDPNTPLKDNGTDVNVALGMPTSVLAVQQQTMADIQLQQQQDELYAAIKRGDRVRVEELIDRGADVNRPDNNGATAMMNAVENNDTQMSREFLQQKANGNIGFDPNADTNLTGGASTTAPNAPGTDNASSANVATAVAQGVTADEARAQGNYALAAQLDLQEQLALEAREESEGCAVNTGWDDDRTYMASAYDDDDDCCGYDDDYYGYDDYYGDDYDDYGWDDDYGYDAYGYDDYGYDDYYGDDLAGSPDYSLDASATPYDPYNPDDFGGIDGSEFTFDNTDLSDIGISTSATTTSPDYSSFLGSLSTFSTTSTDLTASTSGSTSSFFDFSSPTTGTTVWNTKYFDPAQVDLIGQAVANNTDFTVAPTNPYYKPTAQTMTM